MIQEIQRVPGQAEKDPNVWGRFGWFAYFDPQVNEALASGSLGLMVVSPTLEEATEELRAISTDYIRVEGRLDRSPEEIKKTIPREAWEAYIRGFTKAMVTYPDQLGVKWDFGSLSVSPDGLITPS